MELAVRVEKTGSHGTFRNAKDAGDFGMGHPLNVEHGNDRPVFRRKFV